MHSAPDRADTLSPASYGGIFLIAMATLMFEVLLSRVFSATMWYHFAFMAISVAMFGMTFGAILVYLLPKVFTRERTPHFLALTALGFSIALVLGLFTQLTIPFFPAQTFIGAFSIAVTVVVISIPFTFSGMCVCLALTKYPRHVNRLYAADLLGAGLGCVFLVALLNYADALSATILLGAIAAVAATLYSIAAKSRKLLALSVVTVVVFGAFGLYGARESQDGRPLLRPIWVKGYLEAEPLYDKWTSYSRIIVVGDPNTPQQPFGWGLDLRRGYPPVYQLLLDIDSGAGTWLTRYTGKPEEIEFLKHDITSLAHYIREDARVLVVGAGAGRDLLSALAFDQASVTAVEMNPSIFHAVNEVYGDFTGHLDRDPRITFKIDEARSFLARDDKQYDILQISLIDTWAATAAGAFVMSENSLYTVDAFEVFLRRLDEDGILSVTRWYLASNPGEMLRLTALAVQALIERGVASPRDHIVIAKSRFQVHDPTGTTPDGAATLLVSQRPFTAEELDTLDATLDAHGFEMVMSPREAESDIFAQVADPATMDAAITDYPLNIAPPTDESPFFFNMLRFRDIFNENLRNQDITRAGNLKAVYILAILLAIVTTLTVFLIIVPLLLTTDRAVLRGSFFHFVFFAGIGLGFMFIEISQMQRLIVFLGHPTFGLTVVLFSLLVSSGLGSYLSHFVTNERLATRGVTVMLGLIGALLLFGFASPVLINAFEAGTTPVRIGVSVLILFPLGLFMGTAFPMGLRAAALHDDRLGPFLWGVNGSTGVCASVLATAIALGSSISTSYWTGFAAYVVAIAAFSIVARRVTKS